MERRIEGEWNISQEGSFGSVQTKARKIKDKRIASSGGHQPPSPQRSSASQDTPPAPRWRPERAHEAETRERPASTAKLQRSIEELERRIADAAVGMTDAQRRAMQRKTTKQRRADALRKMSSAAADSAWSSPPSRAYTAMGASGGAVAACVEDEAPAEAQESAPSSASPPMAPHSPPLLPSLAIVLSTLAQPDGAPSHSSHAARSRAASGTASTALEAAESPSSAEMLPTALQLAGVARRLWHTLSHCDWKRRQLEEHGAARIVQRIHRGRAARSLAAERAASRAALVRAFLEAHPQWQRTPSVADVQATVLPRLTSGARLGSGAFGCVYLPPRAWHFPLSGVAVKAVSLRTAEGASGLALEAALLRRVVASVGPHRHVIELHSTFLVGEHARMAIDLASTDLEQLLWRVRGAMPRPLALELGCQLSAGLAHLHAAGVAHRDVKLANALLFPASSAPSAAADDGAAATIAGMATAAAGTSASTSASTSARGGGGGGGGSPPTSPWVLKIADLGMGIHSSQLTPLASLSLSDARNRRLAHAVPLGVSRDPYGTLTTMAPEVVRRQWYCPFRADSWSLGICLLTLVAPRDFDEFDLTRPPFYPFTEAHADYDDDYAAFATPRPPTTTPIPPPRRGVPPGLGPPPAMPSMPPGLPAVRLAPPPSPAPLPLAPPGLAPPLPRGEAAPEAAGATARLLERRARLYGEAMPEPPLPRRVLALIDALLEPAAGARLGVDDAARRLRALATAEERPV